MSVTSEDRAGGGGGARLLESVYALEAGCLKLKQRKVHYCTRIHPHAGPAVPGICGPGTCDSLQSERGTQRAGKQGGRWETIRRCKPPTAVTDGLVAYEQGWGLWGVGGCYRITQQIISFGCLILSYSHVLLGIGGCDFISCYMPICTNLVLLLNKRTSEPSGRGGIC